VAIDGHVTVSPDPPAPPAPTNTTIVGDVDGDGKIDMKDVGIVARLFRVDPASPLWNSNCDLNGDGKVDMKDVGIVAKNFGEHN